MKITLLNYTPNADSLVYSAAKSCYSQDSSADIIIPDKDTKNKFLRGIIISGHHSVLEHASFTFDIAGISRSCSHQLVRHRVASFSQQSQRYVKFGSSNRNINESDFVIPPEINSNSQALNCFLDSCTCSMSDYFDLIDILLESGRTQEQAQEDARYLLPNAAKTNITVTMNARELRHFFSLRMCKRAQWEIRDMAWTMYGLVHNLYPTLFYKCGPGCMVDGCIEGTHSCGEPYV